MALFKVVLVEFLFLEEKDTGRWDEVMSEWYKELVVADKYERGVVWM